jgi:hypothetical protein
MNRISDPEDRQDLDSHKISLATELLEDVELSRMSVEQLLLKAFRLARLVEDDRTKLWLGFELHGYQNTPQCGP